MQKALSHSLCLQEVNILVVGAEYIETGKCYKLVLNVEDFYEETKLVSTINE